MRTPTIITALFWGFYLLAAGCTDRVGTVKPDEPAASAGVPVQEAEGMPPSGEIQERGVPRGGAVVKEPAGSLKQGGALSQPIKPGVTGPAPPATSGTTPSQLLTPNLPTGTIATVIPPTLPGQFAFRTLVGRGNENIVEGIGGLTSSSDRFEKFLLEGGPGNAMAIRSPNNSYVYTTPGGFGTSLGIGASPLQPDGKLFTFTYYYSSYFVRPKLAPDLAATHVVRQGTPTSLYQNDFELYSSNPNNDDQKLWILKCGDLGTGYYYELRPVGWYYNDQSGKRQEYKVLFDVKLLRQPDGSYALALQASNGTRYVTAVGGGGYATNQDSPEGQTLKFDRTVPQDWERFKLVDQGNCTYSIQTVSGWFVGWKADTATFSTRVTDPRNAGAAYTAYFELLPSDLDPIVHERDHR